MIYFLDLHCDIVLLLDGLDECCIMPRLDLLFVIMYIHYIHCGGVLFLCVLAE